MTVLPNLLADNPRLRVIAAHMDANRWDLAAEAARASDRCRAAAVNPRVPDVSIR